MKGPLISVIVPVYGVEKYLERCIDSVLSQTFDDFELVLVEDGSPDSCGEICDKYAQRDKRIKVIHQTNQGLSAARNTGLNYVFENSESEWISFVDSDDWIHPEYLERLYQAVDNTNTKVAICDHMQTTNWELDFIKEEEKIHVISPEDLYVKRTFLILAAWGKLYHRFLWENVRYPVGKIREDEFTTWKIMFSLDQISVVYNCLYVYYQRENSIMHKKWDIQHLDAIDAFEEQIVFFQRNKYNRAFSCVIGRYLMFLAKCLEKIYYPNDEIKKSVRIRLKGVYKKYISQSGLPIREKIYIRVALIPIKSKNIYKVIKFIKQRKKRRKVIL